MESAKRRLFDTGITWDTPSNVSPDRKISEYQKNMKTFIAKVEQEISNIISKYQRQIKQLKNKNQLLEKELKRKNANKQTISFQSDGIISPVKGKRNKFPDAFDTVQSNFFSTLKNPFDSQCFLESDKFVNKSSRKVKNYNDSMQKSRFQIKSSQNKQRQQFLLQSLELGKSNLQENTSKMFSLLGKTKKVQNEQECDQNYDNQGTNKKRAKFEQSSLNTSLSSICESLNNSFHAKKSQQRNNRKKKEQKAKQDEKRRKQEEQQKLKKQQGIKNLLNTMRKNISQGSQKQQTIKASKLLTTGSKSQRKPQMQKSKVMINPVPVDALKRSQNRELVESPTKNPPSILKKSQNVLTRSISNISAISFRSSGADD